MMQDENILIRALEPEDLEYLYKWENDMDLWDVSDTLENDPSMWDISNFTVPYSRYVLRQYIEGSQCDVFADKQLRLMITRVDTQEPIGLIDLYDFDPYHQRAGLGIMIHNMENRKQGYASSAIKLMLDYCFETLGLNQVYSSVPSCNVASLKLFEATGFTQTGYRKQWLKRGNEWEDVIYFQQLASTWNNN